MSLPAAGQRASTAKDATGADKSNWQFAIDNCDSSFDTMILNQSRVLGTNCFCYLPIANCSYPRPLRPLRWIPVCSSYRPIPILNSAFRPSLHTSQSKATRETNTEVNRLVVRPIARVVANPFTAGVPKKKRKAQETIVVT